MTIGLIFGTFKSIASAYRLSSSCLQNAGWMVADIFDPFDLLLALMVPIVDVINGTLILETLQKSLILVCDPLRLEHACRGIQTFVDGLGTSLPHIGTIFTLASPFLLEGRDWRHVAFLMLWEILAWPRQDARHPLQQHSIRLFDLSASV